MARLTRIIGVAGLLATGHLCAQERGSEQIVITATREETLASKTPMSVTAISGPALISGGVTDTTTLDDLVPSLSIDRVISGVQATIRGVTSSDVSEKGDPSVAFMLDGIYIARATAEEVSLFDLARVEVLRGPQGTLYGRNSTGGVVNVISHNPELGQLGGSIDATYGNFNTREVTGTINVPVGERIALRAAINYDHRDNFVTAGPGWKTPLDPFKDTISVRLCARFDLAAGQLLLRSDYSRLGGVPLSVVTLGNFYSGYLIPNLAPTPVYVGSSRSPQTLRTLNSSFAGALDRADDTWGVTADFGYELGAIRVNYLGSYRQFNTDEQSASVLGFLPFSTPNRYEANQFQTSHELRVSNRDEGALRVQGGLYYFRETSEFSRYFFNQPGVDPVFGFASDPRNPVEAESWAGFAQATYSMTDRFRLTGGTRYTDDKKSQTTYQVDCSTPACNAPGDTQSPNIAKLADSKTTWRAGLDFDASQATLLYAVYSTGYKAGGFNDGCVIGVASGCTSTASDLYYRPETLTSSELGVKMQTAGKAASANLAAFHYDYANLQLGRLSADGKNFLTTNAAAAKVDGVELEGILTPSRSDRMDLSVSWLNAHYTNYDAGSGINWAGKKLDRSPDLQALAGYVHTFRLRTAASVEIGVHTHLSDSYQLSSTNLVNIPVQFRVPRYTKTNLRLRYVAPDDEWYVEAFGKNLENSINITYISANFLQNVQFSDPRSYGMRAGLKF